jgi:hypothetical protein
MYNSIISHLSSVTHLITHLSTSHLSSLISHLSSLISHISSPSSHHTTSHHITSHHITSHTPPHITSHHIHPSSSRTRQRSGRTSSRLRERRCISHLSSISRLPLLPSANSLSLPRKTSCAATLPKNTRRR